MLHVGSTMVSFSGRCGAQRPKQRGQRRSTGSENHPGSERPSVVQEMFLLLWWLIGWWTETDKTSVFDRNFSVFRVKFTILFDVMRLKDKEELKQN